MSTIDVRFLRLFPLPILHSGERIGGTIIRASSACDRCQHECVEASFGIGEWGICRYGASHVRLDERSLVAGVVVTDSPNPTDAQIKLLKRDRNRGSTAKGQQAKVLAQQLLDVAAAYEDSFENERKQIRDEYIASGQFRRDALEELSPHVQEVAAGLHDLGNLAHQIVANCKTIFEKARPGADPDDVADTMHNEGAIYFTAKQMLGKIEAVRVLQEPSRIHAQEATFRLHGLVSKHAKIYMNRARERGVDLFIGSGSYGTISYSPDAMSVVIQALLDNSVKYAPPDSKITIKFNETNEKITVSVVSLGPKIEAEELVNIFNPGVRGKAAKAVHIDGMGLGLAAAKIVSDEARLCLSVAQIPEPVAGFPNHYETTFSFVAAKTGFDIKEMRRRRQ